MAALGLLLIVAYFVPAIVANWRDVKDAGSITVVNVLLGWTLIGWVVALAMACRTERTWSPPT